MREFHQRWSRRVLSGGPVVLLISDGWDRGDPAELRDQIARLQRSCHRLVWLNPLIGTADYAPLTRGLQAALPFVDDFLPVRTLSNLADLAIHLNALGLTGAEDSHGYLRLLYVRRVGGPGVGPAHGSRGTVLVYPGCTRFEPDGEDRYAVTLTVALAAITGTYNGTVNLTDKTLHTSYRLVMEGQGRAGFVKGSSVISLRPSGASTAVDVSGPYTPAVRSHASASG